MIHVVIIAHAVVFLIAALIWPVLVCLHYLHRKIKLESERDVETFIDSLWDGYWFGVDAEEKMNNIFERIDSGEASEDFSFDWLPKSARRRGIWDGYD